MTGSPETLIGQCFASESVAGPGDPREVGIIHAHLREPLPAVLA